MEQVPRWSCMRHLSYLTQKLATILRSGIFFGRYHWHDQLRVDWSYNLPPFSTSIFLPQDDCHWVNGLKLYNWTWITVHTCWIGPEEQLAVCIILKESDILLGLIFLRMLQLLLLTSIVTLYLSITESAVGMKVTMSYPASLIQTLGISITMTRSWCDKCGGPLGTL